VLGVLPLVLVRPVLEANTPAGVFTEGNTYRRGIWVIAWLSLGYLGFLG
jgi:hypothetical protein